MSLSEFFDPTLTKDITLSPSGDVLTGYWDINDLDVYVDDDVATMSASFVCEKYDGWDSHIGEETTVDNFNYRINKIIPDGTGILNFELLKI